MEIGRLWRLERSEDPPVTLGALRAIRQILGECIDPQVQELGRDRLGRERLATRD